MHHLPGLVNTLYSGGKLCLSAMGNMSFKHKNSVENGFSRDLEPQISKFSSSQFLKGKGIVESIFLILLNYSFNAIHKAAVSTWLMVLTYTFMSQSINPWVPFVSSNQSTCKKQCPTSLIHLMHASLTLH